MNFEHWGTVAIIGVIGWFVTNWLKNKSDLQAKKREIRLKALETAYMRLATTCNRPQDIKIAEEIETFVSEIQLYGTPYQITLMQDIVEKFKSGSEVSYDAMLMDLRDTIRRELALEPMDGELIWWLRLQPLPLDDKANL
jgi:hypothetical protein